MKINWAEKRYFDMNGDEIHDGDTVLMDGKEKKVYLTEDGYLGIDSTNPSWIEIGWACECEFGIYQFNEEDNPVVIKRKGETA